jgi:hypothetical protein
MELYFLWDEYGASFMVGLSHHRQEKRLELFLGLVAIAFVYGK